MLSFNPRNSDYIQAIIIADVMLEKIRVGGLKVPGMDSKQFQGMSLSFIGQTVADHYGEVLQDYDQAAPNWLNVLYKEDAIPYVSLENADRALSCHDFVLVNTGKGTYPYKEKYELIGKTILNGEHIYLVNYCGDMPGNMVAHAINYAHDVVPGFQASVNDTRTTIASTLIDALEKLNECRYVGVALPRPIEADKRLMKAARIRFILEKDWHGEEIAIIGYNTLPNPLDKRDLQSVFRHFVI